MAILTYKRSPGPTLQTLTNSGASLTNNSLYAGSPITLTDAGYLFGDVVFSGTFAVAPSAGSGLSVWFLREDGAGNYEDGSSSVTPTRNPDLFIPVAAVATAQKVEKPTPLPPGTFTVLAKN